MAQHRERERDCRARHRGPFGSRLAQEAPEPLDVGLLRRAVLAQERFFEVALRRPPEPPRGDERGGVDQRERARGRVGRQNDGRRPGDARARFSQDRGGGRDYGQRAKRFEQRFGATARRRRGHQRATARGREEQERRPAGA